VLVRQGLALVLQQQVLQLAGLRPGRLRQRLRPLLR
jgi:hypothetical protein